MSTLGLIYQYFAHTVSTSKIMKMPPECIRCYAKSLRDLYLQMPPFPQRDWPPIRATEPTKLVIITSNHSYSDMKTETLEYDYAYSKIDNIQGYKIEIELGKILDSVDNLSDDHDDKVHTKKSPKPPKVLMDGAPGVGKTTLTITMCTDWARGQSFRQYELVILIPLRQARYRKATKLHELCRNCNDQRVIDHIFSTGGENVAFILDGYDELTYEQREEDSIFFDLIRGEVLPNCAVVVTSRPYASDSLHELRTINRHIEVVGFKKEQIYACVRQNIDDQLIANNLIKQLEEREDIASLCYTPLNCVIMIYIYFKTQTLLTTMTQLFHQFVLESVKREVKFAKKDSTMRNIEICDLDELPTALAKRLQALERIAYKSLIRDQFVFSYEDVVSEPVFTGETDVFSCCLGLVTSISNVLSDNQHQFQFLHLSIQEFLAARYASKAFQNDKQIDLLRRYVNEPRFRLFLLFYAGMVEFTPENAQVLFRLGQKSCKNNSRQWKTKFLYFAHLIYESGSQRFHLFRHLYECFCDKHVLSLKDHKLSQFDCKILAHFFCSIQQEWKKLDLENCSLNVQSLHVFDKVYGTSSTGNATFKSIDFSSNNPAMITQLHYFPWFNGVKEFKFHCKDSSGLINESLDLQCLAHIPCISIIHGSSYTRNILHKNNTYGLHVILSDSKIEIHRKVVLGEGHFRFRVVKDIKLTGVDYKTLQSIESCLSSVVTFTVCEVSSIDVWIIRSASILSQLQKLRCLTLSHTGLTCRGALSLFKSLQTNTSIRELNISDNSELANCSHHVEREEVGYWLETMLSANESIEKIQLCNTINNRLAQFLIAGLLNNDTLKNLDVNNNIFTIDTIQGIIDASVNYDSGICKLCIEGYILQKHNSSESMWMLEEGSSHKPLKLFCAIAHMGELQSSYTSITNLRFGIDLDNYSLLRAFQTLQCNNHVKELTLDLSDCLLLATHSKSFVGCMLENILLCSTVLQELTCTLSDLICINFADGLSKNTSLQSLSIKVHPTCSNSNIIYLLKSLQKNCNLKRLKIDNLLSFCVTDDAEMVGSVLEQYLKTNSTLLELCLNTNETILFSVAKGLFTNKSLKRLKVSLYSFTSFAVAELLLSLHGSKLSEIVIHKFCSLHCKENNCEWDLVIHNEYLLWQQLQHVFEKQQGTVLKLRIKSLKLFTDRMCRRFEVDRFLTDTALNTYQHLKSLDISYAYCGYDDTDFQRIGIAFEKLLKTSSSIEILVFKHCTLPNGVWRYIGKGLRVNKSVKILNLSQADITINDVVSILESLKRSQTLQHLDMSENLKLKEDFSGKFGNAIENVISCNTSLQSINLKISLSDKVAQKVAVALLSSTSSIKNLQISEESLTCSTVQQYFLLLDQARSKHLHLQFDEVLLCRDNEELCQYLIQKIVNKGKKYMYWCSHGSYFDHGLSKFLYGFCSFIYNQRRDTPVVLNLTELILNGVNCDEAIVVFQTLARTKLLSNLTKLSLKGNRNRLDGDNVGYELKTMLSCNNQLCELVLGPIGDKIVANIADGLQHNCSLLKISFGYHTMTFNNCIIANLLCSLSKNVCLVEIGISNLSSIIRASDSSWTVQVINRSFCSLLPHFVWCLCQICDGNVSPQSCSVAETLLKSLSSVKLVGLDTKIAIKLLESSAFNSICKELDVSENVRLVNGENCSSLCTAIKTMLTKNRTLENLNMSCSLNNTTAEGLVAGLEKNKTLRHLCIDANTLKIETIAKIIQLTCDSGLISLTVTDIFVLNRADDCQLWEVKVLDELLWSHFITVLTVTSPSFQLFNVFNKLTTQKCISDKNFTLRFDSACKELQLFADDFNTHNNYSLVPSVIGMLTSITSLTLNFFDFTDSECNDMATELLAKGRQLEKLDLSHNFISSYGMVKLVNALKFAKKLEELDLSNNFDDEYTECHDAELGLAFETLLKDETLPLKVLNVNGNEISDTVCGSIALGIRRNNTLLFLDLSDNKITSTGIKALFQSLECNNHLQNLDLSGNSPLKDHVGLDLMLCRMLNNNKTLTNLKIDDDVCATNITETVQNLTLTITQTPVNERVVHLNCSNTFMLIFSRSGLKIEIYSDKELTKLSKSLQLEGLSINEVLVSEFSNPVLDLRSCYLTHSHLESVVQSLQENREVVSLCLCVRDDLTKSQSVTVGCAIKMMLEMNSTVNHLELYGAINDQLAIGVKEGIAENHSIEKICIEVCNLSDNFTSDLLLFLKSTQISQIKLFPILELSKTDKSFHWKLNACKDHSPAFLRLICNMCQVGGMSDISNIKEINVTPNIDDTLAVLLFFCFEENKMPSQIKMFKLICRILDSTGKDVSQALEKMIKQNTTLQRLAITKSLNDSMALATARGLLQNQTLQRLDLNIACLSDEVLSQLIQSLSCTPLAVICRHKYGQILSFVRCFSSTISRQMIKEFNKNGVHRQSPQLGRVLYRLTGRCRLQELVISSSRQYLQHRIVRSGLQEMLKTCTTLRVLKFYSPITVSTIKGLAAGLEGNKTLCSIEVNKKRLRMSNFKPVFISLHMCALTRLEFIDEFVLQREPQSTIWKINVSQSGLWEELFYTKLCELYRYANIKIDTITVDDFEPMYDKIEFWIPTVNIKIVRTLLRSIAIGNFPVRELVLNSVVDGSDLGIGPDIENALKCKSLKKFKVNVYTYLIDNLLVQTIFKLDFTTSSVLCIEIGPDVLLERKEGISYKRDEYGEMVECREITPWKVTIKNDDILIPLFIKLNRMCPDHSCLCHNLLQSLKYLSSTVTSCELFTILQHNKIVTKLDLSCCSSDLHSAFYEMLAKKSTLKELDLTGIATTKTVECLIKGLSHYSSLKSLSLDIDVQDCGFDMVKKLVYSFMNSNLNQLTIKDVCILHKNHDSYFVNLNNIYLQSNSSLRLPAWSLLVVLLTIQRHIPELKLSLCAGISDGLPLKIFTKAFRSLKEIHLEYTVQGRELFMSIIELLQASTTLTHLCFSHDGSISILDEQSLGHVFEKLISHNTSLKLINFTGQLSDVIVIGLSNGLMCNTTLQTLQLSVSSLTISALASLLRSVHASRLTHLHIADGCTIQRNDDNHYDIKVSGDDSLLCRLFCASIQAQNCCVGLQESFAPGRKLNLAQPYRRNQHTGSTLSCIFTAVEEGCVSELVLSGYNNLTNDIFISDIAAIKDFLLSRTSRLQVLRLHRCSISDSDCEEIACGLTSNEMLKSLDISSNKITSCGAMKLFESLCTNYKLQELDISDNDLTAGMNEQDSGKNLLQINTSLSELWLGICSLLCEYIAAGLDTNSTTLSVLSMEIKEEKQVIRILKSLECNKSVTKLNLSNSSMETSLIGSAMGQMLTCNDTLKELVLCHCDISDDVCDLIAGGLAQNNCLTEFNLSNNWLCGKGILALFKCLQDDRSYLSELDLSSNHDIIHPVDIVNFSEVKTSLAHNTKLKTLKVSDCFCCISKELQRELFNGLQQNSTLEELDISANLLDASTTRAFSDMLSQNTSLVKLNIRWCTFTPWNLENLAKSLTRNPNCRVISDSLTKIALDLSDEHVSNIHVSMDDQFHYDYDHVCGH